VVRFQPGENPLVFRPVRVTTQCYSPGSLPFPVPIPELCLGFDFNPDWSRVTCNVANTSFSWFQLKGTLFGGDNGWHHSLSLSIENVAMCVWIVMIHHFNYHNIRKWVVMMRSRDLWLAITGKAIVVVYDLWILIDCNMIASSSDHPWPLIYD